MDTNDQGSFEWTITCLTQALPYLNQGSRGGGAVYVKTAWLGLETQDTNVKGLEYKTWSPSRRGDSNLEQLGRAWVPCCRHAACLSGQYKEGLS